MCHMNPRTCKHAPSNQLADKTRTEILRWPAHRKVLKELHGRALSNLVKDDPERRNEALDSARAFGDQLRKLDALFLMVEAALAENAEKQ